MSTNELPLPKDPRNAPEFLSQFLPLTDLGDPPPVAAPHRNDRIRLEFLAAYYELNVAYARLLAEFANQSSYARAAIEQEIERLRQVRDRLEDRYAPYGVIAEPAVVKGFAVNVCFTFPDESRWFREQEFARCWEAELRFPLPSEHPESSVKSKEQNIC